jgi:hypothetical protein
VRRKVLRSKARVTRTSKKDHLGKNGNAGVVKKSDIACCPKVDVEEAQGRWVRSG